MASARKTGKYGALFMHIGSPAVLTSVTKVADTFNWRFEPNTEIVECTRKGETYRRYMPGLGGARFSCQARFQAAAVLLLAADDNLGVALTSVPTALPGLTKVAFKLVSLSTEAAGAGLPAADLAVAGQQLIQGYGWCERASFEAPFDNPIQEEFEIMVDGEWEFTLTT